MKEILFATNNSAKVSRFDKKLEKHGIKIVSLKDTSIILEAVEDGVNARENALIKARFFYNITKKTTMAMDDTLYFDDINEELQPGVNVRRVNSKRLNDNEMIKHYSSLAKKYGKDGKITAKWKYAIAIISDDKEVVYEWSKEDFYIVSEASDIINSDYPLNSVSVNKKLNKYFTHMTKEDYESVDEDDSHVVNFIKENL